MQRSLIEFLEGAFSIRKRHTKRTHSAPMLSFLKAKTDSCSFFLGKGLSRGKTSGRFCEVQRKPGSSISLHYALLRGWGSLPRTTSNLSLFVAYSSLSESLLLPSLTKWLPRGKTSGKNCEVQRRERSLLSLHYAIYPSPSSSYLERGYLKGKPRKKCEMQRNTESLLSLHYALLRGLCLKLD
jgi:hypothetical protein